MSSPEKGRPAHPSPQHQVTADYSDPSRGPLPMQPHRPVAVGSMIGKYKVSGVIGYGGMGSVYAAKDPLIERDVAIKILPPELVRDRPTLDRFLCEAKAAGRLNHANVVTIYEVIQIDDGGYAIVMERVNGGSVQNYLSRKGPPGWRAATRLVGEACKALIAAHELGLIHRDIKPGNLLLTEKGHIKIADFGLAKIEGAEATLRTQPGAILGTPAYMSPEQCRGDKIDGRSDIYSLGCTYFAMLTNRPPFEAPSSMQVMFAHCSAPVPDPRTLDVDVPQDCVDILTKALAKDPNDRYRSARELLADLRTALDGGNIATSDATGFLSQIPADAQTPPASTPPPTQEFQLPLKWIITAGAAVVLLVIGFVIVKLWPSKEPEQTAVARRHIDVAPQADAAPAPSADSNATTAPANLIATPGITPATIVAPADAQAGTAGSPTTRAAVATAPSPATAPIIIAQVPAPAAPPPAAKPAAQPAPQSPPPSSASPQPPPWRNDAKLPLVLNNSASMRLRLIHPGTFMMGDDGLPNAPRHEVTLTQPFYIGVYEVSAGEFRTVMGAQAAMGKGPREDISAAFISWDEANEFCQRLSDVPAEQRAGRVYRLPTEAEWEYACRAGTTTRYAFGDTLHNTQANFGKDINIVQARPAQPNGQDAPPTGDGTSPQPPGEQNGPPQGPNGQGGGNGSGRFGQNRNRQQNMRPNGPPNQQQHPLEPRGRYSPNAWGLYDMEGGVWEWCSDFYSPDFDMKHPATDPTGAPSGSTHIARGGCWASTVQECASAYRNGATDQNSDRPIYGFRVVCQIRADK